jgi:hypothetical protein
MTVVLILTLSVCTGPPQFGVSGGEQIIEHGTPTDSLSCSPTRLAAHADTQVVDTGGGSLRIGNVRLTIPPSALEGPHRFRLHQDSGQSMRALVEVLERDPPSAPFQPNRSARLIFDLRGCELGNREWWVWRLNPVEGRSQKLHTTINGSQAIAEIDSTSWFIIAN